MKHLTIVDVAGTSRTAIIDPYSFAEVVTPWFEDAPQEITEAITTLADLVTAPILSPEVDELGEFLGLNITR